jgi:holo-[acyl-carrier protein] synthase
MRILGIGTDLVSLARIEKLYAQFGERFLTKILSPQEYATVQPMPYKIAFLAKRFAGKEAVAKALGCGIGKNAALCEISIENHPSGAPCVHLLGKTAEFAAAQGVQTIHISLSDEKAYALAYVVLL